MSCVAQWEWRSTQLSTAVGPHTESAGRAGTMCNTIVHLASTARCILVAPVCSYYY